jgi:tetratricopeptide (TPR) repeat protein/mono/diheme cytochrome c family protein
MAMRARDGFPALRAACGTLILLTWLGQPAGVNAQDDKQALARQARVLLETHCYRCHGKDGANEGGFNYILDREKLVARRKVIPGQPEKSRLLKRLTSADDPMPPADEKVRPGADDIRVLRSWVAAGAPAAEAAPPKRTFLAPNEMLRLIRADLDKVPERGRRFARYFTLTHLYNAGLSEDELQSYRHALSKLVNSLSWGSRIVGPQPVDPARTVLRIDLRDYQWNEKVWDAILATNPYGVGSDLEPARESYDLTQCRQPNVRADWFVAAASRPPLYYEVLQMPATLGDLEKLLRIDSAENIRQEKVARAGFNSSGVSRNNRLIERHEAGGVMYWISYDFAGNIGRQNLFAHPLGPGDGASAFHHDGGEVIFTLPNGLHAYYLATAAGKRLDKGPLAIVSDPRRPDRAVENGISCMSCHARGMIPKDDQMRAHVLQNPAAFSKEDRETVRALYPPREKFAALVQEDSRRFKEAVAKTGAPLSASEPVVATALHFEAEMGLSLVAAEAGVPSEELLRALDQSPRLAKHLGVLRVPGATVQRQVFTSLFGELARVLRLGQYLRPRNAPAALALARAEELLDAGKRAEAFQAFADAIEHEPDNAFLRVRRGQAYLLAGDRARALADFSEAIRLDPRSAHAYHTRAAAYHDKGDLDRAIADYDAVLRLEPLDPVALNNRGQAYFDKRLYDRAVADYTEALRLDPEYAVAYQNRGQARLRQGEPDKAVADYGEALRLKPGHVPALLGRGVAYQALKDYDRAIADYTEAIRVAPKSAVAFNNRGLAHYEKERYDQAVADFKEAIRLDAKMARAYFNRALAHEQLGNDAAAEADRREAVRLDPTLDKK